MKQHITEIQLQELNEKQKEKILSLFNKDTSDKSLWWEIRPFQISIGWMIEFLYEHIKTDWSIYAGKDLLFFGRCDKDGFLGKTPKNKNGELCDGLWTAVKDILNE